MKTLWNELIARLGPVLLAIGLLQAAVLATSLTACQTTASVATSASPAPVQAACLAFKPIYWSKADTLETQKQARGHNAAGVSLCGWKP